MGSAASDGAVAESEAGGGEVTCDHLLGCVAAAALTVALAIVVGLAFRLVLG